MISVVLTIALIVLVAIFIMRTVALKEKIEDLEWQLLKLKSVDDRLSRLESESEIRKVPKPETAAEVRTEEPVIAVPQPVSSHATVAPKVVERDLQLPPSPRPLFPPTAPEPEKPSRTREEWEAFVGGRLLNRIGAFALILGVGFFLKHAFDNNWISESVRVLIGGAAGLLCLTGAYRAHTKDLKVFAQGLVGAGTAILYLSIYASFNFYALVPQWIAFVLMSAVTAIALAQAFFYDSLAVALLGWAGGFLTPIMLSTGHSNEVGLFTYIALLVLGLLGTLLKKDSWSVLEPLTFAATWLMYAAWYTEYYAPVDLWTTVFFVTIFWLLFHALDVLRLIRPQGEMQLLHHGVGFANGAVFFGVLYSLIDEVHHEWMGAMTLVLGLIYVAAFLLAQRRAGLSSMASARYLLSSMALLAAATAIQFHDFTTVIVWSLEALLLIWCGLRWNLQYVWQFGVALLLLTASKFALTEGAIEYVNIREFMFLANRRSGTLAVLTASVALSGWSMNAPAEREKRSILEWTRDALHFSWCALLFLLLTVETNDYFRWRMLDQSAQILDELYFTRLMVLSVVWAMCSLPLLRLGLQSKILTIAICGIGIFALAMILAAVRGIAFEPISAFAPGVNTRAITMLAVLGMLMVHERSIRSRKETWDWLPSILNLLQVSAVLFLLLLLTGESRDFFEKQIADVAEVSRGTSQTDEITTLRNLQQLALSGVWLFYSLGLMAFGIWRSFRSLRIVAFALFGLTILKIFIYDLSFLETLYRIFSFIGLGIILLAVSYAYQRYKSLIFGEETRA